MYLSTFKGNKSQFITWNFIKGYETELGEFDTTKQKLLELIKKNKELEDQVSKLNAIFAKYKSSTRYVKSDNVKLADAIRNRGLDY